MKEKSIYLLVVALIEAAIANLDSPGRTSSMAEICEELRVRTNVDIECAVESWVNWALEASDAMSDKERAKVVTASRIFEIDKKAIGKMSGQLE